ncbi:hypothetical protein AB0K68_43335, partial [Streptomyces sp. NPDC050698]
VDKKMVKNWFNMVPLSEKRYKEWPQCYHEIFNPKDRPGVRRPRHAWDLVRLRELAKFTKSGA